MRLRLMAGLAAVLVVSSAAGAEDLTAAVRRCAAITDDAARHACYDKLPPLLSSPDTEVTSQRLARPAQAKMPPPEDDSDSGFSFFRSEPIPANHISATVESFTYDYGIFVITLDNGQVWRQTSALGGRVQFSTEKKDQVTIWRSAFGEIVLRITGQHPKYRVRRVK